MPAKTDPAIELEVLGLNRTRRYAPSQIAKATGVSKSTVHRILHRYGVKAFRARPPVYTEEEEREVARLYTGPDPLSLQAIGERMHMNMNTAADILRRRGVPVRSRGGGAPRIPDAELDEVRRLYTEEGLTNREIEQRLGLSRHQVQKRVERSGVTRRTRADSGAIRRSHRDGG